MAVLNFSDVEEAGANFAPVSITLSPETIVLIGLALDYLSDPANWHNNGQPLTDSERDQLDQWLADYAGVYTA